MFCPQCGASLHGEDRFCTMCGVGQAVGASAYPYSEAGLQSGSAVGGTAYAEESPSSASRLVVSNTIVWWLAFAPLLGAFGAGVLAGLTHIGIGKFWWTTLALNIALSIADENHLKKAGCNTSALGQSWLVPVYLFKRAKMLEQNNTYFIVWTVLVILSLVGVL